MRGIPRIPGMEDYPEMRKKFERKYLAAGRDSRCPGCGRTKVVQRFRTLLAERRRRDKSPLRQ